MRLNKIIKPIKKSLEFQFVEKCIFPKLDPKVSANKNVVELQKLRFKQLSRLGLSPTNFVYTANCPPAGFITEFKARPCHEPRFCPWCYIRLYLKPTFLELTKVPQTIRDSCMALSWIRLTQLTSLNNPPFFPRYSYSAACSAYASFQIVMPWTTEKRQIFVHFGAMVIPKDVDYLEQLKRLNLALNVTFYKFDNATDESILDAIASVGTLSWNRIYDDSHLDFVVKMKSEVVKTRFLRIEKYKGK
jgi:hypothetical protein